MSVLQQRFADLLHRHIRKLHVHGTRVTGLAVCHDDHNPSFSADLDKLTWYCFSCGRGGGVNDFATLVGEPWNSTSGDSRLAKAGRARFQAEQRAKAILQRRKEEYCAALFIEFCERRRAAADCDHLLKLFQRRPDLAAEFSDVHEQTERDFRQALFVLALLAVRLEVEFK